MLRALISFSISTLIGISSAYCEGELTQATVNATRLNVRAAAKISSEVLCQVHKNDQVNLLKIEDNWAQIQIPAAAKVWIAANQLSEGTTKETAKIYAGPGILYTTLQVIKSGTPVQVLETKSGWSRISPLPEMSAWVSAKYLIIPPDFTKETANETSEKLPPLKPEQVVNPIKPAEKVNLPGIALPAPGEIVVSDSGASATGMITPLNQTSAQATHALVFKINNQTQTVCYLSSRYFKLNEWVGRQVKVTGRQKWVAGWQKPVIEVRALKVVRNNTAESGANE